MTKIWEFITWYWCKAFHRTKAMWPIHGQYTCPKCLHRFPSWE